MEDCLNEPNSVLFESIKKIPAWLDSQGGLRLSGRQSACRLQMFVGDSPD